MRHQSKTQGFWGWVVLGLCALAVLAGAFQASRTKTAKDPQAIETPSVILDQTDPKGDDAEEVSVPVTIPVLPEKPEVPASGGTHYRRRAPDHRPASRRGDGGGLLGGRPAV